MLGASVGVLPGQQVSSKGDQALPSVSKRPTHLMKVEYACSSTPVL